MEHSGEGDRTDSELKDNCLMWFWGDMSYVVYVGIPGRGHCYGPKWGRQLGVQKEGQTGLLNGTDAPPV